MDDPQELRRQAEHYRRTAALVSDELVAQALIDLAQSYETMADKIIAERREDRSAEQ